VLSNPSALFEMRRQPNVGGVSLGVAMRDDACNRAFFEGEIRRLLGRLYGVALRLTGNPTEAEDLVSETTIKAWSKLDQLKDRQAFPKWVFRILTNTYISSRRQASFGPAEALEEDGCHAFSLFEKLHQPFLLWWSNPERELLNKLLSEDIERALDGLPEGFRAVVVLVDIEGYCYDEVAKSLGVPIGTVRSRLSRARSMLQRALWEQASAAGLTVDASAKEHIHD
jgi:RNA polymerase sigma-70 factor, ECF subfamily